MIELDAFSVGGWGGLLDQPLSNESLTTVAELRLR